MRWMYESPMDVARCMMRLCDPDFGCADELNPFHVELIRLSDAQVYLVYKGRRFSKYRRTEYRITLAPKADASGTVAMVDFLRDLWNMQYPITPISELDAFMQAALDACRKA